jgi:RNA polymerase-binding transcription factor DksA
VPGVETDDGSATASPTEPVGPLEPIDLDRIARDLDGVEQALARLDAGTYWTDEVTGAPIDDDRLAADPTARRAGGPS